MSCSRQASFTCALIAIGAAACGTDARIPRGDPPPFTADQILWTDIRFDEAEDLGHQATEIPLADQIEPSEIALLEVAEAVGLGSSQAGGNAHGVGVAFVDVDGDTYEDIVLVTGAGYPAFLFHNNQDGTFSDISAASGISGMLDARDNYSIAAADFDADGDLDLYVASMPTDVLLVNDGNGVFTDGTAAAGAGGPTTTQAGTASKIAAWGDVNGDGHMDIAVASSNFDDGAIRNGYLLASNGDGTFTDITEASNFHASATGNPCAMMWSDIDADGDQDVWIWNDRGTATENRALLRNDGGVFTNITALAGITVDAGNPMGIDTADLDHDGYLDIYVSDIAGNELYVRQPDGTYNEMSADAQALGTYGWGIVLDDLDADSWTDIFVGQEDDMPYLTFRNQRVSPPAFVEQAWEHGAIGNGHNVAVASADFDKNGTLDIVTASTSGARMNLYRNETELGTNRWLEVRVDDVPERGGIGGISARVVVKTGDLLQFRDITAGSSRASQKTMTVRFGLGQWTGAEWVAIVWPDGRQRVFTNVEGNRVLVAD